MSLIEDIHAAAAPVIRQMDGEAVVLRDSDNVITAEIPDALVSIEPPIIGGVSDGPADHRGSLKLAATHRSAAQTSQTATVRGETWHVVHVGESWADLFTVTLRRNEYQHTNLFDLDEEQAVWGTL